MADMEEEEEVCEESTLAEYMERVEEEELVRSSASPFLHMITIAQRFHHFLSFSFFMPFVVLRAVLSELWCHFVR